MGRDPKEQRNKNAETIVVVLPEYRDKLLSNVSRLRVQGDAAHYWLEPNVRMQGNAPEHWLEPNVHQLSWLRSFLTNKYIGAPSTSWLPVPQTRIGYDPRGVFLVTAHKKRYFGLPTTCVPTGPQYQMTDLEKEFQASRNIAEQPLDRKMQNKALLSIFKCADKDGSGLLSQEELALVMGRLAPHTLSSHNMLLDNFFEQGDEDGMSYREFVDWLHGANDSTLHCVLGTDKCALQAAFRVIDADGHGIVGKRELTNMVMKHCKGVKKNDICEVLDKMDRDGNGKVDSDEVIDWMFGHFAP